MGRAPSRRNAESYQAIGMQLTELLLELRLMVRALYLPSDPRFREAVLVNLKQEIAGRCWDHLSVLEARDLARWAGARRTGVTLADAQYAFAEAWMRRREVSLAAHTPAGKKAWIAFRIRQMAHENNRSIPEERRAQRTQLETARLRSSRDLQRAAIARHVTKRGGTYAIVRIAA